MYLDDIPVDKTVFVVAGGDGKIVDSYYKEKSAVHIATKLAQESRSDYVVVKLKGEMCGTYKGDRP